ncbi:hypothetical protein I79_002226 [Cricetulus griseus]|uniref:Uncharacterized protein n=1 Tax=Cricetulus griseus TaxID=10029 RepID=G3GWU3_CRIGR|nr:hypothetical protein I79_002226 [Cricetulus griseus]
MEMSGSLCPRSLQSPEMAESDVLEGVKLRPGRMAAVQQVLCGSWAYCPSSLGVLALEAPPQCSQCSQMDTVAEPCQLLLIEFLS